MKKKNPPPGGGFPARYKPPPRAAAAASYRAGWESLIEEVNFGERTGEEIIEAAAGRARLPDGGDAYWQGFQDAARSVLEENKIPQPNPVHDTLAAERAALGLTLKQASFRSGLPERVIRQLEASAIEDTDLEAALVLVSLLDPGADRHAAAAKLRNAYRQDRRAAAHTRALNEVASRENPRESAGRNAYRAAHWGEQGGPDHKLEVAALDHGRIVEIGTWEKGVTYGTKKKGDRGTTNYVHRWGEGRARGEPFEKPRLCYHDCDRRSCPSQGKLIVAGGSYRFIPERGIVG